MKDQKPDKACSERTCFAVHSIVAIGAFADVITQTHHTSATILARAADIRGYAQQKGVRQCPLSSQDLLLTVGAIFLPGWADATESILGVEADGTRRARIIGAIIIA